jgi:CheY-like chemotaxis protein
LYFLKAATDFLLVEDSPDDVYLVERAFSKSGEGHRLHVVSDGQEAMDYLMGVGVYHDREKHPIPGVILLDIKMPRISGLEFLQWLQERAPERLRIIPVIVMSGSEEERDIKTAYKLGANCYLVKPIPWGEFEERMTSLNVFWGKHVKTPPVGV